MNGETVLASVGIDIGTTTTQVVLSRLTLVNVMPGSQVPRVEITRKSVIYMGDVHFTPFLDRQRVDGAAIRNIIEQEYAAAGIQAKDIDTGAVIQVPMYLNEGEVIKVDTRDGKFVSRV